MKKKELRETVETFYEGVDRNDLNRNEVLTDIENLIYYSDINEDFKVEVLEVKQSRNYLRVILDIRNSEGRRLETGLEREI